MQTAFRSIFAFIIGLLAYSAVAARDLPSGSSGIPIPIPTSMGGTGTIDGNLSETVVYPTGSSTPVALPDVAARALSQPSVAGGGFAANHLPIGCPGNTTGDAFRLCDSGMTPAVDFNKTRDPVASDDYYAGFVNGSRGYNSLTTQQFVCTVCDAAHPGAAVWVAVGATLAANTPLVWSFPSMSPATTIYAIPGGNGSNINSAASAPVNLVIFGMHFHVPTAPGNLGSGKKITFTLWAWTPGPSPTPGPTASPVVCIILETATDCDSTGSAAVAKGQLFTVQATADAGIPSTGQGGAGLVMQTNPGS